MDIKYSLGYEGRLLEFAVDENDSAVITSDSTSVQLMGYPTNMMVAIDAILSGHSTIQAFAIEGRYGNVSRIGDNTLFNISGKQFEMTREELQKFRDAIVSHFG